MPGDTQWTLVTEATRDYIVNTPLPQEKLADIFPREFVGDLSLTTRSGENAITLVDKVRRYGLRGDDPPKLRLLRALVTDPEFGPQERATPVRELLQSEEQLFEAELRRRAAAGDPFLMTVLSGNEVFIDRVGLRKSLRELHEGTEQKLLLQVTGQSSTGKSYSARLIEHLAIAYGFHRARAFLDDETGTADEVVNSLAMDVATTESPPPAREGDAGKWYGRASQWLVIKARERGGSWWFIVDGLNHQPATSEIWDFVQKLAINVNRYGEGQVRLLLLGYDGSFDSELRKRYLKDEVRTLTREDLREFFTAFLEDLNENRAEADHLDQLELEQEVEDTVAQVLEFARTQEADGKGCFMEQLRIAVEGVVDELSE